MLSWQCKTFFFFILVLRLIKESQLQHGLRHEDYQRYRSYCSRRVKRLRKTLHISQGMWIKLILVLLTLTYTLFLLQVIEGTLRKKI